MTSFDSNIFGSSNNNVPCKFGCGTRLMFDVQRRGKNGNLIPLETDGTPHKCPAWSQAPRISNSTIVGSNLRQARDSTSNDVPSHSDITNAITVEKIQESIDSLTDFKEQVSTNYNQLALNMEDIKNTMRQLLNTLSRTDIDADTKLNTESKL